MADEHKPIPRSERENAARQLYEHHRLAQVRAIIRLHVNASVRQREGTSDIFQAAVKSFAESDAVTADPENLLPRFLVFVEKKCKNAVRQHNSKKRDVRREKVHFAKVADLEQPTEIADDFARPEATGGRIRPDDLDQIPAQVLDPEELAIFHEEMEKLSADERKAVLMRMEGYSYLEIASKTGCSEETARRRIKAIEKSWEASDKT